MSTDDEICWYCHTNKGVLLACKGNCHKYYHTEWYFIKFIPFFNLFIFSLNIDTPEYIGKWLCPDCYNQKVYNIIIFHHSINAVNVEFIKVMMN